MGLLLLHFLPEAYPLPVFVYSSIHLRSRPDVGTLSLETQREMEAVCLRNIMHGLQTGKLSFTVAEQADKF